MSMLRVAYLSNFPVMLRLKAQLSSLTHVAGSLGPTCLLHDRVHGVQIALRQKTPLQRCTSSGWLILLRHLAQFIFWVPFVPADIIWAAIVVPLTKKVMVSPQSHKSSLLRFLAASTAAAAAAALSFCAYISACRLVSLSCASFASLSRIAIISCRFLSASFYTGSYCGRSCAFDLRISSIAEKACFICWLLEAIPSATNSS